jgi:hypothetical protein
MCGSHPSRRAGLPRLVAAGCVLVVVVAGCTHPRPPDPGPAQVARLRALPFGESNLAVVTKVLAKAGVGIYDDTAADGTQPVRVTRWQARNLAVEAANGGGIRGDVLAQLAATPPGAPPIGYLIGAWIKVYDSPASRFSAALLGPRDWRRPDQIVFPNLVLTLFLADATATSSPASGPTRGPTRAAPSGMGRAAPAAADGAGQVVLAGWVAAGPCPAATSFVQRAIAAVANALRVNTSRGGLLGFLGRIWNTAVDLAAGVVKGLIDTVTRPVVNLLVDVFGVVATIAQVTSFLVQWRATLAPEPAETRFGVGTETITGQLRLQVDHPQLPIPALVADCAAAVGVDLRGAGSAAGSTLSWDGVNLGRADLSTQLGADTILGKDNTARYTYHTGQESTALAKSPKVSAGQLQVTAAVARGDIERVRQLFSKLLLDQLPAAIRSIVEPLARPVLDASTRQLAALADVKAVGYATIRFHGEPPPEPLALPGTSGAPGPGSPSVPSTGAANVAVPSACKLLTAADVMTITANPVVKLTITQQYRRDYGPESVCDYVFEGAWQATSYWSNGVWRATNDYPVGGNPALGLVIRRSEGQRWRKLFQQNWPLSKGSDSQGVEYEHVTGIGDDAVYTFRPDLWPGGGEEDPTLYVGKGDKEVEVDFTGFVPGIGDQENPGIGTWIRTGSLPEYGQFRWNGEYLARQRQVMLQIARLVLKRLP